jgi:hypothetical protein
MPARWTVSVAVRLTEAYVAVMTELVLAATPSVVTVKVAVVAPAETVTLAGTVAAPVLELVSDTSAPPTGAPAVRVTVPVELLPPTTVVGLSETAERLDEADGLTVSVAERVTPCRVAVIVTLVVDATASVVTVKVALVALLATVTVAGTVATAVLLLESATTAPPVAAGPVSVMVPVALVPPVTVAGETPSEVGTAARTVNVPVTLTPP